MSAKALSNTLLMDYQCIVIPRKIVMPFGSLQAISYIRAYAVKLTWNRAFGVSEDTVGRSYKKFLEKGEAGFFGDDARKGTAHKITGERRQRIQSKLDKGQSNYSIAKEEGVRESAIRYGIKQGYLKKRVV